jgi:endonuclease YncB( thermonuclease family)
MPDPSLLCLRGDLVVIGKSPDGDSIRFVPGTPELIEQLRGSERADPSADGTLQLRLDGIDTPETHYGTLAQPLGEPARDELLAWCGFTDVRFSGGTVTAATPATIPAAVLSGLVDPNGRPIVLLLRGDELPADGAKTAVSAALVARTANVALAASGAAYGTVYTDTDAAIRSALLAPARAARDAGLGVWAIDKTGGFDLRSQASIGPAGSLILPKLFRRCSDYLRTRMSGETLPAWLARQRSGTNPTDDRVFVGDATEPVFLSTLITQDGSRIALRADLLDLVFV